VRVHLAVEHALELEAADALLEARGIPLDVLRSRLVVLAFGELEQLYRIRDPLAGAVELTQLGGQLGAFAPQLLRLVRLLPDGGIFELATDLFETLLLGVVLKETP
jgi:hypothetical protein